MAQSTPPPFNLFGERLAELIKKTIKSQMAQADRRDTLGPKLNLNITLPLVHKKAIKMTMPTSEKIDPLQLELLEMFSTQRMSRDELRDIKLLIANYYAQKADTELDRLFDEKGWDVQEKVTEWGQSHDRTKGK